jgi:hypothetical protein
MDTETVDTESIAYNTYLELLNKKFNNINNITTKKVFLISLNKNFSNFRSLGFLAEFNESFKNNYEKFLNSDKSIINFKDSNTLDFEYYNSNFDFHQFKNEIYILFKENKMALLSKKFKNLNTIKTFKFLFKEDVLADSNLNVEIKPKSKVIMIPDLKKLQY